MPSKHSRGSNFLTSIVTDFAKPHTTRVVVLKTGEEPEQKLSFVEMLNDLLDNIPAKTVSTISSSYKNLEQLGEVSTTLGAMQLAEEREVDDFPYLAIIGDTKLLELYAVMCLSGISTHHLSEEAGAEFLGIYFDIERNRFVENIESPNELQGSVIDFCNQKIQNRHTNMILNDYDKATAERYDDALARAYSAIMNCITSTVNTCSSDTEYLSKVIKRVNG